MPYLLGTGRFRSVAYLTSQLRKVTRETTLDPRHKKSLDELRVSVSATGVLTQLFHVLEDGTPTPTPESLGTLLREMRSEAIQTVLVWIGQLNRPEAKTALVTALDQYFTQWPGALSRVIRSPDRTVVHRALRIAGRLELPEFVDPLSSVLDRDDEAARRIAVTTLASIGTGPALRAVVEAISDPDAEVRTATYTALTTRPHGGALTELRTTIESVDLEELELSERRALFSAFGAVSGAGGVSTLEPVLMGKGRLKRRASAGTRACAALGLGIINTPAARFALAKGAKERDPLVRSAAGAALRADGLAS
jgi:HEAT repeat protein